MFVQLDGAHMTTTIATKTSREEGRQDELEWQTRVDLAACYRLVDHFGMCDMHLNHISARVPGSHEHFLINPFGMMYEEITASFEEERHPKAVALACRGLGRICTRESDAAGARAWLQRAVEAFVRIAEVTETAQARVDLARALLMIDDRKGARRELSQARTRFELLGAQDDLRRVEELEAAASLHHS